MRACPAPSQTHKLLRQTIPQSARALVLARFSRTALLPFVASFCSPSSALSPRIFIHVFCQRAIASRRQIGCRRKARIREKQVSEPNTGQHQIAYDNAHRSCASLLSGDKEESRGERKYFSRVYSRLRAAAAASSAGDDTSRFPLSSGRNKAPRQIERHLHIDSLSSDLMLTGYQFDAAALMPVRV